MNQTNLRAANLHRGVPSTSSKAAKQHSSYGQAHSGPPSSMPTRPFRTNPARLILTPPRKFHPLFPAVAASPAPPHQMRGPAPTPPCGPQRPRRQLCFAPTPAQGHRHVGPTPITPQSVQAAHASLPSSLPPPLLPRAPPTTRRKAHPRPATSCRWPLAGETSFPCRVVLRALPWGTRPNSSDRVSSALSPPPLPCASE
jgi:hypothetical protein